MGKPTRAEVAREAAPALLALLERYRQAQEAEQSKAAS